MLYYPMITPGEKLLAIDRGHEKALREANDKFMDCIDEIELERMKGLKRLSRNIADKKLVAQIRFEDDMNEINIINGALYSLLLAKHPELKDG